MTAKTTRLLKEARPLFWPWCAVVAIGALPLIHPPEWMVWISRNWFFVGISILPTLALGNEFQHRTLSLLLSQPVSRMEIWAEKMSVTLLAVLSAALAFSLAGRGSEYHWALPFLGVWILASVASATFWTLFARSTLGGIVLNVVALLYLMLAVGLTGRIRGTEQLAPATTMRVAAVAIVFLPYAGVMLWLGWRTLARFQMAEGTARDALMAAGPGVMLGASAGWLRCRPAEPTLNLIRKEFHLLLQIWVISLLTVLGWAGVAVFRSLSPQGSINYFEAAVTALVTISTLMIAVLGGSLSLGERRRRARTPGK